MNIAGVEIGVGHPCRFVAEISNNHNGDLKRAIRLIDAAKAAGADFVKFQCYTPDELVTLRGDGPAPDPWGAQGWTMRQLYEKAQTPFNWFPGLVAECKSLGIPWFSSVFGDESLKLLEALDCPAYKIARLDVHQNHLVNAVGLTGKPFLASTHEWIGTGAYRDRAGLLYCPPGYPPAIKDIRLPEFTAGDSGGCTGDCDREPSIFLGLSSHCLDPRLPVAAVSRGAKLLEYHFQLDDEPSELEADVSLTATQFRLTVEDVYDTEEMLGAL